MSDRVHHLQPMPRRGGYMAQKRVTVPRNTAIGAQATSPAFLPGTAEEEHWVRAVQALQDRYGLPVTGVWDDATRTTVEANARGAGQAARGVELGGHYTDLAQVLADVPTACAYCGLDFTDLDTIDHGMHGSCYEWTQVVRARAVEAAHPRQPFTAGEVAVYALMLAVIVLAVVGLWL